MPSLEHAAACGHVEQVRVLRKALERRGADAAQVANLALVRAAAHGKLALVESLCHEARHGVALHLHMASALCAAAERGHLRVVRGLGKKRWAREAVNGAIGPALQAAWVGDYALVVRHLLRRVRRLRGAEATGVRRAVARHLDTIFATRPAFGRGRGADGGMRSDELWLVHEACVCVMVPEDEGTWFRHPLHAGPLLTRALVTASRSPSYVVLRVVVAILDATPAWSHSHSPSSVAAAVAAAEGLLEAALPLGTCASHELWCLLRDACARLLPRGCCLTATQRGTLLASVRRYVRHHQNTCCCSSYTCWSTALRQLVTHLRGGNRFLLLFLRMGRDAGRMVALTRYRSGGGRHARQSRRVTKRPRHRR